MDTGVNAGYSGTEGLGDGCSGMDSGVGSGVVGFGEGDSEVEGVGDGLVDGVEGLEGTDIAETLLLSE